MNQRELNRAVARATGEDLAEISRRGFSIADPAVIGFDPEPCEFAETIDWDELGNERGVALFPQCRAGHRAA